LTLLARIFYPQQAPFHFHTCLVCVLLAVQLEGLKYPVESKKAPGAVSVSFSITMLAIFRIKIPQDNSEK